MDTETNKKQHTDFDFTFERVPDSSRKKFWPMFFIMLGFTFFSASMSVGAKLGNGLDLGGFAASVLIGGLILACYTGLLAYVGSASGLSFDLLAQRSFGKYGSYLPSAMIGLTQIGWFGVGVAMFAIPASEVLGCNKWILIVLAGVCMTASAYFGIKGMEIVSYISVPLIAILGVYSMVMASNEGGGLNAIFAKNAGGLTLFEGVGLVIGSFVSGGTTTPNFTRFSKSARIAIVTTVIAFFIGNSLMFAFGAVGGAFTQHDDIFYVMITQGLTVPALLVLGANIWTTNDNALYSGALGLSNITKVSKCPLVLVCGVIGTVAALWLYDNFISWLNLLNATLPPIGVILVLDYFLNRKDYSQDEPRLSAVNIGSVTGVILGALVGNFVHWGVASVNAMAVACACYFACKLIRKGK
ncbi:MAG: cytosine permease [Clostridia bacterium]|nr:cytosine permease [Clostridia bacterium]